MKSSLKIQRLENRIEELEEKIKILTEGLSELEYRMKKVTEANKELREENIKIATQTQKDIELQQIKLESAIENMKNMITMYSDYFSENFKTIFGEKFVEKLKEKILEEVSSEAKKIVKNTTDELLYDKMEHFLKVEIRRVVIENGGDKLEENVLSYIIDSIVKNVIPQIMTQRPSIEKSKTNTGEILEETLKPVPKSSNLHHYNFNKLLDCINAGLVPMLVGPAGTGKSTAVEQAAQELGLKFYMANRVSNTFEIVGYKNAAGEYVSTQFYEAYKNGGLFLFDEIDGSDPEALVTINTAIAQGYMAFPCGIVPMNPNFKLIAAGNTYGTGPDAQYCGRNQLDSATLDRFVVIEWGYDKEIERKVCKDKELLEFAWALRKVCEENHLNVIISTRGIIATDKLIGSESFSLAENIQANLLEGVKVDILNTIKGGLYRICGITDGPFIRALDEIIQKQKDKSKGY